MKKEHLSINKTLNDTVFYSFYHPIFSEDRIRNGAKKLAKARTTTQQGRLDSFFTVSHNVTTTTPIAKKAEIQNATNKGLKRKKDATPKSKASGSGFAKKHK
ncbi:unnamed protein product [Rotaria socialis]|uniref:Uncharacterized protein n=1 Tax=Rotaria socialis TaxID=392032 RepID=A0A818NP01_9BILA|nr:unnamed protein product [Rotaria socialis]